MSAQNLHIFSSETGRDFRRQEVWDNVDASALKHGSQYNSAELLDTWIGTKHMVLQKVFFHSRREKIDKLSHGVVSKAVCFLGFGGQTLTDPLTETDICSAWLTVASLHRLHLTTCWCVLPSTDMVLWQTRQLMTGALLLSGLPCGE